MKKLLKVEIAIPVWLICLALLVLSITACSSFNATVYNATNATADAAIGSYRAFNRYYHSKTNSLGSTTQELENFRTFANEQKQAVGRTLLLVEQSRLDYAANKTKEGEFELQALLTTLDNQSSNLVQTIQSFISRP